jgi:hypothetical protein
MCAASEDARNTASRATSPVSTAVFDSSGKNRTTASDRTNHGATAFTWTSASRTSAASALVNAATPSFAT